ncbi:MAG: hypothetical protein ACI9EF_003432, partial [Pseudohongiellaceae bacterium]
MLALLSAVLVALLSALLVASSTLVAQVVPTAPDGGLLVVGSPAPALTTEHWVKGEAPSELERGKVYVV